MTSRPWIGSLIALALGTALGWLAHGWFGSDSTEHDDGEEHAAEPWDLAVPVRTAAVETADFEITIDALGRVRTAPGAVRKFASRAGGRVVTVGTRTGARVNSGDLLVGLDPAPLDRAIAEAQATVDGATAELSAFDGGGAALARARLETALETARRDLEVAQREHDRLRALQPDGLVSERAVAEAEDGLRRRRLELASAQADVANFTESGAPTEHDRLVASRNAALAKLDEALALRGECELRAETDGTVIEFAVEPGLVIEPGTVAGSILCGDECVIDFELTPREASGLRVPTRAAWTLGDGSTGGGRIVAVLPTTDPSNGMVTARAEPDPAAVALRAGDLLHGAIEVRSIDRATVIPVAALVRVDDQPCVFRIGVDHCAHRIEVNVLARRGDRIAVDGTELHAGDRVVVTGAHNLPDGAKIVDADEKDGR